MLSQIVKKYYVLGMPVHLVPNYTEWLLSRLYQGLGVHVITLNAEMTMQARENPALAQVINQADLVVPDGAGVVLYLQLRGNKVSRCPGIELAESLLRQAGQQQDCPVFFYGGSPQVAEKAADLLQQKIPGLKIAGIENGYLSPSEQQQLCQTLQKLQPRIILVGLGVPRQEFWISQHRHLCPESVWIGVGGSFDIWAGVKTRAPGWMQKLHLEWLYRLYQEPWRWRRMLALPHFAWKALLEATSGRSALG